MNYLDIDIRRLKKFKSENSKKVDLGNRLLHLSHFLRDAVLRVEFDSPVHYLLVQDIFRHYQEALIFAMRGEAAMCLSMIRIGVEGTRNLLRILENPTLTALFLEGPTTKENRKKWRREFLFDEENESALLQLYNLSSDFGVHARVPLLDPVGVVIEGENKDFLSLGQSRKAKDAFVLALHAIEISNIEIMKSVKPLIATASEEANSLSASWWNLYKEISVETKKYFKNFHQGGARGY